MDFSQKRIWVLYILSIAYLVLEIAFNIKLVDVASQSSLNTEQIKVVELFGRALSGVGAFLLILGWLAPKVSKNGLFPTSFLIFIVVWPLVYFGQRILVDEFIIERSSAKTRQTSYYSLLIADALSQNNLKITGLNYQADEELTSVDKTFLAVFPAITFQNKSFGEKLESKKSEIIEQLITNKAHDDFDDYWESYQQIYQEVNKKYLEYAEGVRVFKNKLNASDDFANEKWANIEQGYRDRWQEMESFNLAYQVDTETEAGPLRDKVIQVTEIMANCLGRGSYRDECLANADRWYKEYLQYRSIDYVPIEYWKKKIFGFSSYTKDAEHYYQKLLESEQFKAKYKSYTGFNYFDRPNSFIQFRTSPEAAKKTRKELAERGVTLPDTWIPMNDDTFKSAIKKQYRNAAEEEWNKQSPDMSPYLSEVDFQRHPIVQRELKAKLGEIYVPNMLSSWGKPKFYRAVVVPNIKKQKKKLSERLKASIKTFDAGGENETVGENAVRGAIVPFVSLVLSLALLLMTALKLIVQGVRALFPKINESTVLPITLTSVLFAIIFITPNFLIVTPYNKGSRTLSYFTGDGSSVEDIITRESVNWLVKVQPLMYNLGNTINEKTMVFDRFSEYKDHFEYIDEKMLGNPH